MSYWTGNHITASKPNQYVQFETQGHPGKYYAAYKHTGGEFYFTGSNYGYGAVMFGSGSLSTAESNTDKITLSGGGDIVLKDLATVGTLGGANSPNSILDLSILSVSSSVTNGIPMYFFKRQK